ncbi:aspartyl-phosphate phosphatase Spo0E family protein [Alkalihalobacillus pseudalcaliphilus]|uniref:aspartyl-phosphate phosphatase Spo0E family protein n=1 Tax=Alkalihalobacillus pseudalcaliphilus TaxID=79884 RepID=UPI0009FCD225|nr:aspartyl-phosphate phosphatase Spo0E family protein [Alkalihalobacillus pseudalcaliphilus]
MKNNKSVERLLIDIEESRDKLNKMALHTDLQSTDMIACSQQLDLLIHEYHNTVARTS